MNMEKIEVLLERLTMAMERIASAMEQKGERTLAQEIIPAVNEILETVNVESPLEPVVETQEILRPFLNSRNITIKFQPPENPADQVIDRLSVYLGDNYNSLSNLLAKIKRAMQRGETLSENLKDRTQFDINASCQFCTLLYQVAFLEQYQYLKSPNYLIKAKTTTLPKAHNFFSGQWLERYLLQKIKTVFGQVNAQFGGRFQLEYLLNPQIVLPNGDDFELDILAAFGNCICWFEAKSGEYQQHVGKYSKFTKIIGLDENHSFMVLTDISNDRCNALSSLFNMKVCNLSSFEELLTNIVRGELMTQFSKEN